MSLNLPDWFIPKYREEYIVRAQQKKRKLEGLAQEGGMFIGDDCHFPRFGSVETYKVERLKQMPLANANMDFVKASAEPEFVAFGIWDPDKKKLNTNVAGAFADATVRAVNRARDRQHIDALAKAASVGVANTRGDAAENIVTIGDYNTVADLELFCEAFNQLGTNEMFEGEKVSVIAPFKINLQQSLDPFIAKSDMKTNRIWDQVDWRSYERLPGNGALGEGWLSGGATGVDMFVHVSAAVGTAVNDEDTEINERLGSNLGDMTGRWFQSASVVLEPKGVIRVKSKLDFALLRHAFPTHAV